VSLYFPRPVFVDLAGSQLRFATRSYSRTGRWRSIWTVDTKADKLHGEVFVDVHYFEAGNVSHLSLQDT
jgi:hypothetical protein